MASDWPTVAIVGGGFSGAAVAYHMARAGVEARIVIFEPRPLLGAGLAYGGRDAAHRINVPSSRMSMLPEDEGHFTRWLESSGVLDADPESRHGEDIYARRRDFGRYVDAALRPLVAEQRVRHVRDIVVKIARDGAGWRVRTRDGDSISADLVALATTHPKPTVPVALSSLRGDARLIVDGLSDSALNSVSKDDRVLIVGTGLTAADLVASLDARGHEGPVTMISRRGLRSRSHPAGPVSEEGDFSAAPARTATELLTRVRHTLEAAQAAGRTWHGVFDRLRSQGGAIWSALEPAARRRVARHLRLFWDAHRFRIAPQIDALVERKLADGSLAIRKTRLGEAQASSEGLSVEFRDVRRGTTSAHAFDRVIVATGPAHGAVLTSQLVLQGLAADGFISLDPTGLGLRTSNEGRAIGASGLAEPSLFVAGPLARGTFGELMGQPQVSIYALFIAERIGEFALAARVPA